MANLSTYLLGIMGIAFILQMIGPQFENAFIFIPSLAFEEPWRFISSIFLHADPMHIFFNAYALFLFGSILEQRISKRDYLIIFFGAGLLGGILYYLMSFTNFAPLCQFDSGVWPCPALGASGAIYGLLGAVAILLPDMPIFMMFIPMKMRYAAIFWFALSFFGTFTGGDGIAHAGHLGGMIFGLAYAFFINRKPLSRTEVIDPESWGD